MEFGLAVGGAFLSSALNVIFDRLAPKGEWLKIFQQRKHDLGLFKKLRMIFLGLQAVLGDAERKKLSNRSVSEWLNELQDAVEDAENILEEINYQALKLKVESQHHSSGETSLQQLVSDQFLDEIMPRVEETIGTLKDLQEQIGDLGLLGKSGSRERETCERLPTTSVVDDSDVYGRNNETELLVNHLLLSVDKDDEKPVVVPIVGMGGLGKTTLAKVVYNNQRVQSHFDLKAWVCVSEQYDAFKITKALMEEIGSLESIANDNLNQIQVKLKEQIKGKKFLFVLDDIWNDSYVDWVDLKSPFVQGKTGSKVIVTTRKDSVALMMGSDQPMYLKTLSIKESWSLFKRHIFKNKELREDEELQEVGNEIARKCKGLPLALKAIAGLLRSKPGIEDCRNVLRSGVWEQSVKSSTSILPALQLSYNDLPQHLKRCFAYLAIFPKDFPFDRDYVVQLWIANDLVQQAQTDETIEDTGNQYFLELLSRSLIEEESEKFMMHDLINDLALLVSSKLCLRVEDLQGSHCITHLLQRARHLSYESEYEENFKKFEILYDMIRLRTLLPLGCPEPYGNFLSKRVLHNILPKLACLRALSLSHYLINELPDTFFIKLNQLRFLDLSYTPLKRLPTSTCVLYNLQTLLLSHCQNLHGLLPNIENLSNLRYLDVRDSPLLVQTEASKLKKIKVLLGAKFNIGVGTRIEELGDLHNLRGQLSISELQNIANGEEAVKAKLREKEHIKELSLQCSPMDADDSQIERDILDKLQPSTKIRELKIEGYRGTKFPNWLGDKSYCKLVKLSLKNCNNCDSLPTLGQLPSLKCLGIEGMRGISKVTEEFYGNGPSSMEPFQSLVELSFVGMPEWKEWLVLGNGEFHKLENLSIRNCPKLIVRFPEKLFSLRILSIDNVSECCNLTRFLIQNGLEQLKLSRCKNFEDAAMTSLRGSAASNLKKLSLRYCHKLKSLPIYMCDLLPSLEKLDLGYCPELDSFPERGLPCSLENLTVSRCKKLMNSYRKEWRLQDLPSLKYLEIRHDGSDKGIVTGEGWELPFTLQQLVLNNLRTVNPIALESLTSLQTLSIWEILTIQSLLDEGVLLHLTSLQCLRIGNCNQLHSLPEKGLPSSLSTLEISYCPQLKSLSEKGLPSSLSRLAISNCPRLQSLPEKGLPSSLSDLSIRECPQLESLPEKGLPSSLSMLYVSHIPRLERLLEKGLPSSLSKLSISYCSQLQSLPEKELPSSLSDLSIWECPQLQSLPKNGLPSSLTRLSITNCPELHSLPENGLLSSISELRIYGCPLLKSRIEFEKGVDWPKVAHIPTLFMNGESM